MKNTGRIGIARNRSQVVRWKVRGLQEKGGRWGLPNSRHVIPRDQTSTLPSYCPSSIAKITSGAILEHSERPSTDLPVVTLAQFCANPIGPKVTTTMAGSGKKPRGT